MKTMDITDPKTYSHFKDCHLCGWSFDPEFFDGHNCKQMIEDYRGNLDHILEMLDSGVYSQKKAKKYIEALLNKQVERVRKRFKKTLHKGINKYIDTPMYGLEDMERDILVDLSEQER